VFLPARFLLDRTGDDRVTLADAVAALTRA
jgi:hypothetical protein